MYPVLLRFGGISVYAYGLFLVLAIAAAALVLRSEFRRHGRDTGFVPMATVIAGASGLVGAWAFAELERSPGDAPGGISFLGGLIFGFAAVAAYLRSQRIPIHQAADALGPGILLAYGIARIGCFLAGDGDYGLPTLGPLGMTFPHGAVPTLAAANPALAERFRAMFPDTPVPADIPVLPTPLFEAAASFAMFAFLWRRRIRLTAPWSLFSAYCVLGGAARLAIEFVRLNPRFLGLSQAQWISIGMILGGALGLAGGRRAARSAPSNRGTD